MLPVLALTFLLIQVQALPAAEFPNLMQHVEVTWGNTILTSRVHTRQTISTDGEVPAFIFCGPFKTSGKDGDCSLSSKSQYKPSASVTVSSSRMSSITARYLSTMNETYSCMSFENKISEFADLYSKTERDPASNGYDISYTCQTSEGNKGPLVMILVFIGVFALVLLCSGCGGYKFALKRNQKKASGYQAYNNPFVMQGGRPQGMTYGGNKVY